MIVIVGGNARNVGKTTLVGQIIAGSRNRQWVAVKISGHPHGDALLPASPAKPRATDLFLAAGAAEALLLRENTADRAKLTALAGSGCNLIVESNRAVTWIPYHAYVFVWDENAPHPKPRQRWHLERASWVLPPRQDALPALLAAMKSTQL